MLETAAAIYGSAALSRVLPISTSLTRSSPRRRTKWVFVEAGPILG